MSAQGACHVGPRKVNAPFPEIQTLNSASGNSRNLVWSYQMKTTVLALATIFSTSVLVFSQAHAAPVFKPADNATGWKQQSKHPGDHKSRMRVMNESAQWRATHAGPGTPCPGGEIYCGDNHTTKMMEQDPSSGQPGLLAPADTYIGP